MNPIDLKILRRIWERINITTTQSGVMDSEAVLQLIDMAETNKYIYPTIKDFEKDCSTDVTIAFKTGWNMARLIKEEGL